MFTNKYPGVCNNPACKSKVVTEAGFIQKIDGRWVCWCKKCVPAKLQVFSQPESAKLAGVRMLTADCKIITPAMEPENYPLIKSLPGARWNPANKWWDISPAMADRCRVLEVADRMGLEVAACLREIEITEQAQNAMHVGLYPFQVEGVNFLAHKTKALLGDDMGLGKTVQALMTVPAHGQALVICRAGLKLNWLDEVNKWRSDLTPVVLSGRGSFRWPATGEVVIINHDILPKEFRTLAKNSGEMMGAFWVRLKTWRENLKKANPEAVNTILIVDEAHDYKTYDSQRSRKVKEIGRLVGKLIGLTGSPLANHPQDLYGVFDVLGLATETFGNLERFKTLFNAYDEVVNRRGNRATTWGKPQPIVPELLRRVMLRRIRSEVLPDLPNKTYTNIVVGEVDSVLQKQLDALWEKWGSFIEVNGQLPPFEQFSEIREKLARSRIPAMVEYIENTEEQEVPLVVFSAHLAPLDVLLTRPGWAVISGVTSIERRQQIVHDFQDGKLKGVGISIRAGGVGITLTHAWKALFVDLDWTPGSNWQAEDRICRIGQKSKKVDIVRMVSKHPLDLHVHNLLVEKVDTIHKAIDGMVVGKKAENSSETDEQFQSRLNQVLVGQEAFFANQKILVEAERKALAKGKVGGIHRREKARLKKAVLPLTPARTDAVRTAFQYMLSVCDGALTHDALGFNKPDAAVAHCLLSAGLETDEEVEAGQFMLIRYRRQLEEKFPILFKE